MLSISTGKNQSMKVYGAIYIPTYEYNYKVSKDMTQHYKNITSPTGANTRIQRDIQL